MNFILNRRIVVAISSFNRFKSSKSFEIKMQVFTQKRNPLTGGTEWDVQNEDYDFHQEIARSAFADMLHDTERNKKYYRALQLAINKMHSAGKKANVLDIGTGTGLLSMMAAKCGADSIVACEAFQPMAECCLKILASNGVADKIKVIAKRSTELTVGEGEDMNEKANILVTEVFDTELIGEGALSTFSHAHKYLLEEDCIVVPNSAIIYAQVVECQRLQDCNKLIDMTDPDLQIQFQTPQKMKDCPGSAAVHDIQLSQLPRTAFCELSEQIPVFYYDWSGRSALDMRRKVKQQFTVTNTGSAQAVFMWWELNMDTEGKIVLSCAPWWCHPDADMSSERPQDTIPWRDHWMQGVYYLPKEVSLNKGTEANLISCQDEYSLWFYIEDHTIKFSHFQRPVCECGVHMALSRTQVSSLNSGMRNKKILQRIKNEITKKSVFLDLNGSSFMGILCAIMNAKKVYIIENTNLNIRILEDLIKENKLSNVNIISEVDDDLCKEVTAVICDPNFSSSILPWENLKMAHLLNKLKDKIQNTTRIIPEGCEFWAMPVEFKDLHKIRVPLDSCEGFNMTSFDSLVERSRTISDDELEAQPLWEYPCRSRGRARRLLKLNFHDLQTTYARDDVYSVLESESEAGNVNGFALWANWKMGDFNINTGPLERPVVGQRVAWNPHYQQAVKILKKGHAVSLADKWTFQVAVDLERGQFNLNLDLVNKN